MSRIPIDPVIEVYKKSVDRSLLRENLKLTPAQRLEKLVRFSSFANELRRGAKPLASGTQKVENGGMKTSIDLDEELLSEVEKAVSLIREKPATVIRLAIRAGLPVIANRFQAPRPDGYFASDYPLPKDRQELEKAMSRVKQGPDR